MEIESFEKKYNQIFKQVHPNIKGDHKKGTLSTVIYSLFDNFETEAEELCRSYEIKDNASLDEDLKLSENIIYTIAVNKQKLVKDNHSLKQGGEFVKNITRPFRQSLNSNEDKMELILGAAIILVGAYFFQKLLSKPATQDITSAVLSRQLIPTAICLAVPASAVYGLTLGKRINREKMIELIEAASEFLCIEAEKADQQSINTINQQVSADSQLKFYIRIDIENGQQSIIDAKTQYVIKHDLPNNAEGEIKQLGRLRDASILKSFNRI